MLPNSEDEIRVLMSEAGFKEILRENHVYLKEHLNVEVVLDYLYQDGVMEDEEVAKCRCRETPRERCQYLLDSLKRKTLKDYMMFCAALGRTQPDIKEVLDRTAESLEVPGLVFVSKSEVEAEFNQKLARKDEEIIYLRQDTSRKIEDLEKALVQQCRENDSLRSQLMAANKETHDLRHRFQVMRKGIGDTDVDYWLKDSLGDEKLLLFPFNLEVPPCPVYLETKVDAEVEVDQKVVFGPHLLELGLYETIQGSTGNTEQQTVTWGIRVVFCPIHHFEVCTQVLGEGKHLVCFRKAMPSLQGTKSTFNFGIVMDVGRGKLGFTDINRDVVLGKFDIDFRESQYQMLAVGAKPDAGANVMMNVKSGSQVTMDKHKQELILQILH